MDPLLPCVSSSPLVDHHCHGVLGTDPDRDGFESNLTEAGSVSPLGTSLFDSSLGLAVRRWCAPLLDLPPLAPAWDYVARRRSLGAAEVNRAFLSASGISTFLVDGGVWPEGFVAPSGFTGSRELSVLRLERLAEDVVPDGAAGFPARVREALASSSAVAAKSVAAYRVGLELDPRRPSDREVVAAADRWLASGSSRCADEVITRFLVWEALDRRLPVQFHVGCGDPDLSLHRCDPLLLTGLLRATAPLGVRSCCCTTTRSGDRAVREVPVLHRRVRRVGAVLPGCVVLPPRAVGLPVRRVAQACFRLGGRRADRPPDRVGERAPGLPPGVGSRTGVRWDWGGRGP